jgi:hypothetical protein
LELERQYLMEMFHSYFWKICLHVNYFICKNN